jgi:hypothetical protein
MPYKDESVRKAKHAEYSRKYYEANKEKVLANVKVNRAVGKARWDTFKRTLKCTQCGFNHPAALDFHHTNPSEKENLVSKLVSNGCFAAAMEEVQKCIVLCANCHRVHHAEEQTLQSKEKTLQKRDTLASLTTNQLPEHAGQR